MSSASSSAYVLGHSDHELLRLELQAAFFADQTETMLRLAGLRPGMNVVDIGCGVGDVSLVAGNIVGPTGSVVGLDKSEEALEAARRRVGAAGLEWVRFEQADLTALAPRTPFDALIGRFILIHFPNPSSVLRKLKKLVRTGGVVALLEMDISSASTTPAMPLFDQCIRWILEVYRKAALEPDMGSRLFGVFRAAGLLPRMSGACRVEGGSSAIAYDYLAETVRSLMPNITKFGVARADEIAIEDLAQRLREQAIAGDHCLFFPRLIGAWADVSAGSIPL